ncbi:MAG TPA: hypothetical protein VK750_04865 [Cytophagaceae bacterium]|jgi:hypothetical protein|nr:hypothetical protein [Cytophagaceae bacterium]
MKLKQLFIQSILLLLFGLVVLYLEQLDLISNRTKWLVCFFALVKSVYFCYAGFKKLLDFSRTDLSYFNFLIFLSLSIPLVVVSFAVDYYCLYKIDPDSFSGIDATLNVGVKGFKFFFLSVLVFSNLGVTNIVPVDVSSEFIMMLEAILSFVTIIFVLSDFISLKESLHSLSGKNKRQKTDGE